MKIHLCYNAWRFHKIFMTSSVFVENNKTWEVCKLCLLWLKTLCAFNFIGRFRLQINVGFQQIWSIVESNILSPHHRWLCSRYSDMFKKLWNKIIDCDLIYNISSFISFGVELQYNLPLSNSGIPWLPYHKSHILNSLPYK